MHTPRAIFILGMHRSGTSALSGALATAGVWFGPEQELLGAQQGINDKGFWEHRELVSLNEVLLTAAGVRWFTPLIADQLSPLFKSLQNVDQLLIDRARALVSALLKQCTTVAIKDPRLCLLAPFWKSLFEQQGAEVSLIHLLRHPAEVQSSLARRDGIQPDHANALWLEHTGCVNQYCIQWSETPRALASYDQLMSDPEGVTTRLLQSCGLKLTPDSSQLQEWIQPDLRHHRTEPEQGRGVLAPVADRLYQTLLEAGAEGHRCSAWSPGAEMSEMLAQLSAAFEGFNQATQRLMLAHEKLDRLGENHAHALETLAIRDTRLAELQQQLETLGENHAHALAVVAQRDQQLEQTSGQLEQVIERAAQLEQQLLMLQQQVQALESRTSYRIYKRLFIGKENT